MGNYALFLVLAGVASISMLLYSSRQANQTSDIGLARHTYKSVVARDAASTGLNLTVRKLVSDTTRWTVNPTKYEFVDQAYKRATFTTDVQANYLPGPLLDECAIDTIDVISTGFPDADSTGLRNHRIEATYVRTCSEDAGAGSSGLGYGTISDKQFSINGETLIFSPDPTANADIHTNQNLYINGDPEVEGFGTYVSSSGNLCDSCDGFEPNDDVNGGEDNVYQGEYVEIPTLSAADFLAEATYVYDGDYRVGSDRTIDFTNYQGITGYGTAENPFVWYIKGDLEINSDLFMTLGYVKIIVEGYVLVNSDAKILASNDADAPPPPSSTYDNPNEDAMREWISTYYSEGTAGIYVFGTKDGKSDEPGVHFNGKNVVTGNIYSIGDVLINGDTTNIGSITTKGKMHYNGKNVLWYVGGHESIDLEGESAEVQAPDGIRLLSYSEW